LMYSAIWQYVYAKSNKETLVAALKNTT